jgi:ankyrin repeat protein
MVAIRNGHAHIAEMLLNNLANPWLKDIDGMTVLDLAEKHGLGKIAKRLRRVD